MRKLGELDVVGLPAVGLEQSLGFGDLHLLRAVADVGHHAADLVEVRSSAARTRWSAGNIALKCESKEKNTEAAIDARSITHSTALRAMMRTLCA